MENSHRKPGKYQRVADRLYRYSVTKKLCRIQFSWQDQMHAPQHHRQGTRRMEIQRGSGEILGVSTIILGIGSVWISGLFYGDNAPFTPLR